MDWAYEKAGIKRAFTAELRPSSDANFPQGFLLGEEHIKPQGEEFMAALNALMENLAKNA